MTVLQHNLILLRLSGYSPFYSDDDEESFELTLSGQYSFPEKSCWMYISDVTRVFTEPL